MGIDKWELKMAKFNQGDTVYIVESNRFVREAEVKSFAGGLYLIRFKNSGGGIKVKEHRLYASKEEAEDFVKYR